MQSCTLLETTAHRCRIRGLSWVGRSGPLVSAGEDGTLKFWEWTKDSIQPAEPEIVNELGDRSCRWKPQRPLDRPRDFDKRISHRRSGVNGETQGFQGLVGFRRVGASPGRLPSTPMTVSLPLSATCRAAASFMSGDSGEWPRRTHLTSRLSLRCFGIPMIRNHCCSPTLLLATCLSGLPSASLGRAAWDCCIPSHLVLAIVASPDASRWFLVEQKGSPPLLYLILTIWARRSCVRDLPVHRTWQ